MPASVMLAWHGLSSSEYRGDATCRWLSGYGRGAAVEVDSRVVVTIRWLCVWLPELSRLLRPLRVFSCLDFPSLVSRPRLCRKTNGSAAVARLSPCPSGLSVLARKSVVFGE